MSTAADIESIEGVGKSRVEKYGAAFLEILCSADLAAAPAALTATTTTSAAE